MKCYITIVIIKWRKRWIWYCYVIDDKEHCNTTEVTIVILNINVKQNTCSRSTFIRMWHPSRSLLVRCCRQIRMRLAKLCGWPTFPPRRTAGSTGPDGLLSEKPIAQRQAWPVVLRWHEKERSHLQHEHVYIVQFYYNTWNFAITIIFIL